MPFSQHALNAGLRHELTLFVKRTHHPRPAGRARTLHLTMQRPLQRGPTPDEVKDFAKTWERRSEEHERAIFFVLRAAQQGS